MDHRNSLFSFSSDNWDIVTSKLDGSAKEKVARHEADDLYPVWSPDDRRIAFLSDRSGVYNLHLYIAAGDGSKVTSVAEAVTAASLPPVWSPDGTRLAFVGIERLPVDDGSDSMGRWQETLFTVKSNGSDLTRIGSTWSIPSWSPDCNLIAHRGESALIVAYADGSGGLSSFPTEARGISLEILEWSPDGRKLLLSGGYDITIIDVETTNYSVLSPFGIHPSGMWASRSPDGTRIAFSTHNSAKYRTLYRRSRIDPAILLFTTK